MEFDKFLSRLENSLKLVKNISIAKIRRMSLKDDVTFGVSTKQAPHCLAWAVLAGRFGRLAGWQAIGRAEAAVRNCTKTCLCLREVVCWLGLLPCCYSTAQAAC